MKIGSRTSALGATFLALFVTAASLPAQDWKGKARIDGRVVDEMGEGIAGAKLAFRRGAGGGGPDVVADKKGRWAYLGLVAGEWNIDVQADGYLPYKTSIRLSEINRLPPMVIRLEKAPPPQPAPEEPAAPKGASVDVIAMLERGNQLLGEKNFAGARAEYEKALAAIPENPLILRGIAQTYYGEKKIDEAIATLKRVVELDANDATALLLLANLQVEKGNIDEGKATLAKVPAESIKDPGVYTNLGILLLNKKKPEDAWTYFDQAVKVAPADADAYFYRGLTALQLKRKAEAKADLQKYLELAPDGAQAADAKELLKSIR